MLLMMFPHGMMMKLTPQDATADWIMGLVPAEKADLAALCDLYLEISAHQL